MLFELPKIDYFQLTSINHYFGEKIAFEYAFMSFYSCWMVYPGAFGAVITGYQIYLRIFSESQSTITLWAFFYAALISIWVSVFIERWRRKSNELRIHFGTLHMADSFDNKVRPEFIGNEEFSHENFKVNTKDV